MSSFSSSANYRTSTPLPPNVDHRSLDNIPNIGLNCVNNTPSNSSPWNGRSLTGNRLTQQAIQLANQFHHQLQVNSDTAHRVSTNATVIGRTSRYNLAQKEHDSLVKEELMERLKAIIHAFMVSPSRQYRNNNITFSWMVDNDDDENIKLDYSVTIIIKQPSRLV